MTDRERVLKALRTCLPETEEEGRLTCEDCPYESVCCIDRAVALPIELVDDIRAVLDGRKGRLVQ